jgi:hypothetical protein
LPALRVTKLAGKVRRVWTFRVRPVARRQRRRGRPLRDLSGAALLLAAALLAAGGCGSARRDAAAEAAGQFVSALGSSDMAAACRLLAPDTVKVIESLQPQGCQQALPTLHLPSDPVTGVRAWGDAAQARSSGDVIFLRELPEGWRVVAAGCRPRGDGRPYDCSVGGGS